MPKQWPNAPSSLFWSEIGCSFETGLVGRCFCHRLFVEVCSFVDYTVQSCHLALGIKMLRFRQALSIDVLYHCNDVDSVFMESTSFTTRSDDWRAEHS
jgi:hypothetical protein